jgi:hypothetical protein
MIFPGRQLASGEGLTIWQRHEGAGYHLHVTSRGIVLDLSQAELAALARIAQQAIDVAAAPEDAKDHARRLQILQARVTDYVKRERGGSSADTGAS